MSEFDVVLEHVSKTFPGGARAVIDFSAELRHGEFVAMLGPSGCGKTTTLRMIGGLEEATERKIFIAGKDVTDLPPARRDTSMMFQSFALFPHRTVFQNVEFSLKMKGMDKTVRDRRVWEMLEMVELAGLATRRPRDLSGGQQQRVALARALISRPTVLLLDEPLGSLDFNLRQAMMIELKRLQRELNITFIMVTHSQQEALSLADKVIVMSDALIQQIGTSREVHENPRNKFVAEFIGNNNLFEGKIQSRSGSIVFVESLGQLLYVKVPPEIALQNTPGPRWADREHPSFQKTSRYAQIEALAKLGFIILKHGDHGRTVKLGNRTFMEGHLESLLALAEDEQAEAESGTQPRAAPAINKSKLN